MEKSQAIYQNNKLTFLEKKEGEPVQPVQKNIYKVILLEMT